MDMKYGKVLLLAASLGVSLAFSPELTSSAKTGLKVKSETTLKTYPSKSNVTFTGKDALYSKIKGQKGAKLIASRNTLKKLANSELSVDNFVAQKIATTNSKKVFYKIKSFNGKYTGWIYGGKSSKKIAGGLKPYQTFRPTSLTEEMKNNQFIITSPGFANDGKTVTYQAPENTEYGKGRVIGDSISLNQVPFKIDKAGVRGREKDLWVHIKAVNPQNSFADGWILLSGLSTYKGDIPSNAIQIRIVTPHNQTLASFNYTKANAQPGQPIGITAGTTSYSLGADDQAAIQQKVNQLLQGTGYGVSMSGSQASYLASTPFGGSSSITALPVSPVLSDSVKITLVNDRDQVLNTVYYTPISAAAPGTTLGSNGQLGDSVQGDIQSEIDNAFKDSAYSLKLSQDQITQLANTQVGSTVELQATMDGKIADNAVRINLVDSSTHQIIKSFDYSNSDSDDPAPKGSPLGKNGVLADSDASSIALTAQSDLSGTGYQFGNLPDSNQLGLLAAAKLGSSVDIPVSK